MTRPAPYYKENNQIRDFYVLKNLIDKYKDFSLLYRTQSTSRIHFDDDNI